MKAFSYNLPRDRIAQRPVYPAHDAKLLLVDRKNSTLSNSYFCDLPKFLGGREVFVFNNTKVIPARIYGRTKDTGAKVEVLLLREEQGRWLCLGSPLKKFKPGRIINISEKLLAEVLSVTEKKEVVLEFFDLGSKPVSRDLIFDIGHMPIPPYIRGGESDEADNTDYQTIFAKEEGSVAASTASLHFTSLLLSELEKRGCEFLFITLHMGTPSIYPAFDRDGEVRSVGGEFYKYDPAFLQKIQNLKQEGKKIIAVGTSVVRALESMAREEEGHSSHIESNLFIKPGFEFLIVDEIITNYHQPQSSHLLLVEAFMGEELLGKAYEYALTHNFRFLSYGDGMWVR